MERGGGGVGGLMNGHGGNALLGGDRGSLIKFQHPRTVAMILGQVHKGFRRFDQTNTKLKPELHGGATKGMNVFFNKANHEKL